MGYLPKQLQDQVKAVMKAAYRLDPKEGMAKLLQSEHDLRLGVPFPLHDPRPSC